MSNDRDLRNRQWLAIRRVVLVRDGYRCYVCQGKANTVDHIVPRVLGGSHHPDNLRACCLKHNSQKGNRAPAVPITSREW